MEQIVLAVKGKSVDTLPAENIDLVKKMLPEAKHLWRDTSSASFDPGIYEFDKPQTQKLRNLINQEQQALMRLEQALVTGDKQQIIAAGMAIKPNFAKIFKSFGRFPASG